MKEVNVFGYFSMKMWADVSMKDEVNHRIYDRFRKTGQPDLSIADKYSACTLKDGWGCCSSVNCVKTYVLSLLARQVGNN